MNSSNSSPSWNYIFVRFKHKNYSRPTIWHPKRHRRTATPPSPGKQIFDRTSTQFWKRAWKIMLSGGRFVKQKQ